MTTLLHKQVAAEITDTDQGTDQGEFTALAAAYSTDRVNERIVKGAFHDTILRWQGSARNVPLAWDHSRDARDIIGSISPSSMRETDEGLFVEASLDLEDSEQAREAWRSVKANRVGLSFGYLVEKDRRAKDGVKELLALDLYEVTLTSSPANPDARILSAKSVEPIKLASFEL
jgi:HK97 family phage prohead protease